MRAKYGLPDDWQFWQRHDRRFIEVCDEVVVLMLDRWQNSVGVAAEIEIARAMGKPVTFVAAMMRRDSPLSSNDLPDHRPL